MLQFRGDSQELAAFAEKQVTCSHHATIIENDSAGNVTSTLICNANLPADHAYMAQQLDREGANCAAVDYSNI